LKNKRREIRQLKAELKQSKQEVVRLGALVDESDNRQENQRHLDASDSATELSLPPVPTHITVREQSQHATQHQRQHHLQQQQPHQHQHQHRIQANTFPRRNDDLLTTAKSTPQLPNLHAFAITMEDEDS